MRHTRRLPATIGAAGLCMMLGLAGGQPSATAQETSPPKSFIRLEDLAPVEVASAPPAIAPAPTTRPAARMSPPATMPTAAGPDARLAERSAVATPSAVHREVRELWRDSARPLPEAEKSVDLQRRVRQLQALQPVARPAWWGAAPATIPPLQSPVSLAPAAQTQPAGAATQPAAPAAASRPSLAPGVLERLRKAPADGPGGALALADALFRDGHVEPAGSLYETVLAQAPPAGSKDWALFQLANCKLQQDPQAALELYQRLAKECPDSPWAAVGAAQVRWIEWTQAHIAPPAPAPAGAPGKGT